MTKQNALSTSIATSIAILIAACASPTDPRPTAHARLEALSGNQVAGSVSFVQNDRGLLVEGEIVGLTPGLHGFHIHEVGDCSAPDGSSTKGHFNPDAKAHGHYAHDEHHAGDMPGLVADATGTAKYRAELDSVDLSAGAHGILGRSVVIHADADDYKSQPAGNSGKRIACGVIVAGR